MTAKYTRLPTSDPEAVFEQDFGSIEQDFGPIEQDFGSIFTYNYPKYFPYAGKTTGFKSKYKSIFTYSDYDPCQKPEAVGAPDPTMLCTVCATMLTIVCYLLLLLTLPVSAFFAFKKLPLHERLVIFRLGRLLEAKGPGLVVVLPCIDKWKKIELRTKAFSVPPQMIATADGGVIEVGAEMFFRVKDPMLAVNGVQDLDISTRVISQTCLQRHLSKKDLTDVERDKASMCSLLQSDINQMTLTWGVEVSRVELSPIKVLQQASTQNPLNVLCQALGLPGSSTDSTDQLMPPGFTEQMQAFFPPGLLPSNGSQQLSPPQPSNVATLPDSSDTVTFQTETQDKRQFQSPRDLISAIQLHLSAELVRDFGHVYKFLITGVDGGMFYLDLKTGEGSAGQGNPPDGSADVTLTMSDKVMVDLLGGQMTPFNAYMGGQLKVEGDFQAAAQLGKLADVLQHV